VVRNKPLILLLPALALLAALIACAQDCIGVTFSVKGYIVDSAGHPVQGATIHVYNQGDFEKPPLELLVMSDQTGYFQTDSVFSYACTKFEVDASAPGYQLQPMTFYPPANEGWPNLLPSELRITLQTAE
jgi:hypothetical protein